MAESVGEAEVVLADVLVVVDDVFCVLGVVLTVHVGHLAHSRYYDVAVVGGPPEHPEGLASCDFESAPAFYEVVDGLRDHVR